MPISTEEFFRMMGQREADLPRKLEAFLDALRAIDVRPEYRGSLQLRWDRPGCNPVNLGYIMPSDGTVWTEQIHVTVGRGLGEEYLERLASALAGTVKTGKLRWVARADGKAFRIEEIADRLGDWRSVIEDFQSTVRRRTRGTDS